MKLHWSPRSPYVRKVMICAHELQLVDRIEPMRSVVTMSRPNPAVIRDNPIGKIPTLITDDGRALFDSLVICEYLDSLHGGAQLFPAAGAPRWEALRWHALGDGMLDTLILWRNERQKPAERQTPEWLSGFALKLRNAVDTVERESEALARGGFGIGHVAIVCALGYMDFRLDDLHWRDAHPRSAAWFEQASKRASVSLTLPYDD
jgi:glutathione S-transferase